MKTWQRENLAKLSVHLFHVLPLSMFLPEAPMVVDQGMLKVSKMVESIRLHVQGQWVTGKLKLS